jgi:protein-S-isoprenylcysteine O-methyltransferase Ste14
VSDATSLPATPWDFKARAAVFAIIFGVGFFVGYNLQYNLYGNGLPTYVVIGQRYGLAGIHAAAFLLFVLILIGFMLRVWGTAYLSTGVVWNADTTSGGLLLSGPYRYVRNPLYLGNLFAAAGIGMIGPPWAMLIIVVGVTAFCLRLIAVEERFLTAVHGQAYLDYRKLVPALIPRLTPAPVAVDPRSPKWADGFWGETFYLAFVVAALYNALFTQAQPGVTVWLIVIAVFVVANVVRRFVTGKSLTTP